MDAHVSCHERRLALPPSNPTPADQTGPFAIGLLTIAVALLLAPAAHADKQDPSPARRIDRDAPRHAPSEPPTSDSIRTIDGGFNNAQDADLGAAHTPLRRLMPARYSDGVSALSGAERPGPRAVSNAVHAQSALTPNPRGASDFLWQWGQFLDHDIDLTDGHVPAEPAAIAVPSGDAFFDPNASGNVTIPFSRSFWDESTGTDPDNPRQQVNEITGWIDASNVYGSDDVRALALRTLDGTGRLATSEGDLLPFNAAGLPNAGGSGAELFLAGDVRANEQLGLTVMHALFVREHNRIVGRLADRHPDWTGEQLYEKARQLVGAEMQVITYREFLPALLGRDAIDRYRGYDPDVDPRIANVFSTAAYRFGHSALSPTLLRLDANGEPSPFGPLSLREAFFAPYRLVHEGGLDPVLRGLAAQACQTIDAEIVDDVRNFLFGAPGQGGFDLASLNIQRGRDHGLPSYVEARAALGLASIERFADVNPDPIASAALAAVYDDVDEIDLWTGGLSEPAVADGHLGETFRAIVIAQFEALRDGDRLWYARVLSEDEIREVEGTRLSDVIRANTGVGRELPDDVFHVETGDRDDDKRNDHDREHGGDARRRR